MQAHQHRGAQSGVRGSRLGQSRAHSSDALPALPWDADLQRAAARCEPVINAYYGNGFHSEPDPQHPGCWVTVSDADEAKQRMTMKSDVWGSCELSPGFRALADSEGYKAWSSGLVHLSDGADQDYLAMLMGL